MGSETGSRWNAATAIRACKAVLGDPASHPVSVAFRFAMTTTPVAYDLTVQDGPEWG